MDTVSASRRGFLRGSLRTDPQAIRPPWALAEADFIARCTRCDECARACPSGIVVRGTGGFPVLDFSHGECSFCRACVDTCRPAALTDTGDASQPPRLPLTARIGNDCLAQRQVECRVCGESCPTGAIRFRPRLGGVALPSLDAEACTGCGACFAPCPSRAITLEKHA